MSRLAANLMVAVLALAVPTLLQAEVRIARTREGVLSLAVQPTQAGIWTPLRAVDAATVNPSGDTFGDGYPGYAASRGRLLAAWNRRDGDFLVILRADGAGPVTTLLPASHGVGTPVVVPISDAWVVAWSSADVPEGSVLMAVVSSGGESQVEVVSPGRLVAVIPLGGHVHVLTLVGAPAELWVTTYFPLPTPIPITTARIGIEIEPRASMHLPQPFPISTSAAWTPCIEMRETDALVAWSARDHQVGSIVLDSVGVVDAAKFVRGPSGSCTAVLNAAERQ